MRPLFVVVLIVGLVALPVVAQETDSSTPTPPRPPQTSARAASMSVYVVDLFTTAPELLRVSPQPLFAGKCKKQDGTVAITLIVDSVGAPRNPMVSRSLSADLNMMALQIATTDQFKPGTHNGIPVAVTMGLEVSMQGCIERAKDESGRKIDLFHLRSQPTQKLLPSPQLLSELKLGSNIGSPSYTDGPHVYRVGGNIKAPIPLNSVEARYTTAARKARIEGVCLVSFIVDANGTPLNLKVIKSLDPGLDQNALNAVSKYRFKPAMNNDKPVPVILTVEVNFQLK
jgi:TonB family protein